MKRTIAGLVVLLLAAPGGRADDELLPPPRVGNEAPGAKAGNADNKAANNERPGGEADPPPPRLYPALAFPPAAPAVVDPRTGAWEQVRSPGGEVAGNAYHPAAPVAAPIAVEGRVRRFRSWSEAFRLVRPARRLAPVAEPFGPPPQTEAIEPVSHSPSSRLR